MENLIFFCQQKGVDVSVVVVDDCGDCRCKYSCARWCIVSEVLVGIVIRDRKDLGPQTWFDKVGAGESIIGLSNCIMNMRNVGATSQNVVRNKAVALLFPALCKLVALPTLSCNICGGTHFMVVCLVARVHVTLFGSCLSSL